MICAVLLHINNKSHIFTGPPIKSHPYGGPSLWWTTILLCSLVIKYFCEAALSPLEDVA